MPTLTQAIEEKWFLAPAVVLAVAIFDVTIKLD